MRFTVRRPASAEVSARCHRPSGGDVTCGVDVGVARARAAGDALENRLALAVFRRDMPAMGASLRRIRCRDELKPPHRFMFQPGYQQSPPLAADRPVKTPFLRDIGAGAIAGPACRAGHRPHVQVLHADGVEPARQISGGFFHPVTAAIGVAGPQPRDRALGSCSPVGSALRPGQTPLQSSEPSGFTGPQARSVQQLAAGQRDRCRHAAIDTDNAAVGGSGNRLGDRGESDVPAPRSIHSDAVRLHRGGDSAGPPESHPTDLGYPDLSVSAGEPVDVVWFESNLPESLIPAGLSPRWAPVGAVEEVSHRLGEVAQRLLLHGLRSGCQPVVLGAGRRQLGTLLVVPGCLAAWLPVLMLFHGQIPHKPGMPTVLGQCSRLLRAGKQPKPAHRKKLGVTTDNLSKGGTRRFHPRRKPGACTPQIL